MGNRFSRLGLVLVFAALNLACQEATQVTFDITTDVPCDKVSRPRITVAPEGEAEKADPYPAFKTDCRPDGTLGALGTFAVYPKGGKPEVIAGFTVSVAVGDGVTLDDCTPAKKFAGCVVARRRIGFVPRKGLVVPVQLWLICKDVVCDENSTCNRAGKCVSSKVDLSQCTPAGVCDTLEVGADGGLPCFNAPTAEPLVCTGDNGWCTRSDDGVRACAVAPGMTGVSYECRDSRDCGRGLFCVSGLGGVLGRCTNHLDPGDRLLCTLGQPNSPCAAPLACEVDAGAGLLSCSAYAMPPIDGGTGPADGLRCPRDSNLFCSGVTPFCSEYQSDPLCVSDGGAQCWYSDDCARFNPDAGRLPDGGLVDAGMVPAKYCFAGTDGRFSNVCSGTATTSNPVALCNPKYPEGDCPAGSICDTTFYGNLACRRCPSGYANCNNMKVDGCETFTDEDLNNCGACGNVCHDPPRADAGCNAGACNIGACQNKFEDCDTIYENGCEQAPRGSQCTHISNSFVELCREGYLACDGFHSRPVCAIGNQYDAGSSCGDGGVCNGAGECLCQNGTPVNTPCGLDSVCNGNGRCVRNKFWEKQWDCDSVGISGDDLCRARGYMRATSAWGYSWAECGGPNSAMGLTDNCRVYTPDRSRCIDWLPGVACNGAWLGGYRFGTALKEYGGPPDFRFVIPRQADGGGFWGRGCGGFFPGYSIRTTCEF